MSSNKSNDILSDKNGSNDFTRPAIAISSLLKIVVIKNTRDSLIEREFFIISLSVIVNISENLLIFTNIELSLTRELEDIRKISSASNTSLDINSFNTSVDLAILSRSILIIKR